MELWNVGILGCYATLLKNISIHEIKPSWNERISIEGLRNLGCGKMLSPFRCWLARYSPVFHSNSSIFLILMEKSSKLIPRSLIRAQKSCAFNHHSSVPIFHHSICVAYHNDDIKSYLLSNSYRISEALSRFFSLCFKDCMAL